MKCPFCGCQTFYVKDPEDEYEIYEFGLDSGDVVFSDGLEESECPAIENETLTYCNECAWHGKFRELKE